MFLKKVKNKIRFGSLDLLIKLTIIINSPKLTARILAATVSSINPGGKYKVLCLRRSIFMKDIEAMAQLSGKINYLVVDREHLRMILFHFLTKSERGNLNDINYYVSDLGKEGKIKYYQYIKKMFPLLKKLLNFQAGIAGNFGYIEQQEFARVCLENNIPFMVLHKEGLTYASGDKKAVEVYKNFRFIGTKMLVYNNQIRDALLELGVEGLSSNNLVVVGIPRMDRYFLKKENQQLPKQVVLFSFYPSDKFLNLFKSSAVDKLNEIKKISQDFHLWAMKFAKNYNDYKVIIKTKSANQYIDYVQDIVKQNFSEKIENLVITNDGDVTEMINNSRAVLGFKSTTLLEGIIANRLIVSPYFGDVFADQSWDHFADYTELVQYAKTEQDLEQFLLTPDQYLNYRQDFKNEFLEKLIYIPDGQASYRAEQAVIETIN